MRSAIRHQRAAGSDEVRQESSWRQAAPDPARPDRACGDARRRADRCGARSADERARRAMMALRHWLQLSLTSGLGPVLQTRLIEACESAEAACSVSQSQLRKIEGIGGAKS